MYIFEQEGVKYDGDMFAPDTMIRGGRNITFNDAVFSGITRIHIDRDIENITFNRCILDDLQIGYFVDEGILDGLVMNECKVNRINMFYSDYLTQLKRDDRRTKGMVLHKVSSINAPYAPFVIHGCDNPIIEDCTGLDAHGDLVNTFQINACQNPVLRRNVAGRTVSTSVGDGIGIILDWMSRDDDMATTDALVENNICFGSKGRWSSGISNFKGIRSVIRRNTLIDNQYGLHLNQHDDFHVYDNNLKDNVNEVRFSNGATSSGYGVQI